MSSYGLSHIDVLILRLRKLHHGFPFFWLRQSFNFVLVFHVKNVKIQEAIRKEVKMHVCFPSCMLHHVRRRGPRAVKKNLLFNVVGIGSTPSPRQLTQLLWPPPLPKPYSSFSLKCRERPCYVAGKGWGWTNF